MRKCPKCGEADGSNFYLTSNTTYCKRCQNAATTASQRKRRALNPEAYRARQRSLKKGHQHHVLAEGRCLECDTMFKVIRPYDLGRKKFCSRECRSLWYGRRNTKAIEAIKIAARKPEVVTKQRASIKRGPNHPQWIDGRAAIQRPKAASRHWRNAVFQRDDYTCQACGLRGGRLQADHIKPYATHPECRWDITNGRTLCVPCHMKTPTFAGKLKKQLQMQSLSC